MHRSIRLALALALMSLMGAALAVSVAFASGGVTVELTAHRVTKDARGAEALAPAEQAKPGELLEYRAHYKNAGTGTAKGLAATLPIPRGTQYVPGSALPGRVEASLDGKTFAPIPLMRKVKTKSGRTVMREVPASEYRALRWPLGTLPANQEKTVAARVRVEATPPVANDPD
jgi:uncharacterized repeat protein (TIGR01451 family)